MSGTATPITDGDTPEAQRTAEITGRHLREVQRVRVILAEGPDAGLCWEMPGHHASIGTHPSNELVIGDRTVSRFHCEIRITADRVRVHDLGSLNGTLVDGVEIIEAFLRDGSVLRIGETSARVEVSRKLELSSGPEPRRFGSLVAESAAMRSVFAMLERAAGSHANMLLEGETGTGKTQVADSIHRISPRSHGPFVTVECSAVPANLLESELFGHEKGAFTGAGERRIGLFEEADGGTLFLDEIGELPLDLQPKLLRALETRHIRRVGSSVERPVDVRVIAATNRHLRAEVNAGRFRADLYYRLAVIKILIPPLRERPEDILPIAAHLLSSLGASAEEAAALLSPEVRERLLGARWPGNVREMRNTLERYLILRDLAPESEHVERESSPPPAADAPAEPATAASTAPLLPLTEARQRAIDDFERHYLEQLLATNRGRVAAAARAAGLSRVYLYKLLTRHGLKR